ncbi:MAG: clostripain-related cysteine peptidase, partial [Armatimonadota bacterium]
MTSGASLGFLTLLLATSAVVVVSPQAAHGQGLTMRDVPLFPLKPPPARIMMPPRVEGISNTIPGVPEYTWWYGCSPTAAGMIIGWWDGQPGRGRLFDGDGTQWFGDLTSGTRRMVASQQHHDAGQALGLTYGSYLNHTANCIADFFQTHNGGTSRSDMAPGLVDFCAWDDPTTASDESCTATATTYYTSSGWTYQDYCDEIDAGRPVHLGLTSTAGGHSVTGIGYDNTGGKQEYLAWTTWSGWPVVSWGWTGESQSGYNFSVYAGTYLQVDEDVTGPVVAATYPADGTHTTLDTIQVSGSAASVCPIDIVEVRVNGGGWQLATGTDPWYHTVALQMGSNLIEARTKDDQDTWSDVDSLTVQRDPRVEKSWAFLVYLDGDNNLEDAAIDDLNEMEVVGSTPDAHILVQCDRISGYDTSNGDWTECRRYYVEQDSDIATINSTMLQSLGEVNMGDPATLQGFIEWAVAQYPAQRYAVVLWNHGGGWRIRDKGRERQVCWDDTDGDVLYTKEIRAALEGAGAPLAMLGFDVCLGGMIEPAYEVAATGLVSAMAASPASEPWDGWPYNTILADLVAAPTMTGLDLADVVVTRYGQHFSDYTMSAYDLSRMPAAASAVSDLAHEVLVDNTEWTTARTCQLAAQQYETHYRDLRGFAENMSVAAHNPAIRTAAQDAASALGLLVSSYHSGTYYPDGRGVSCSLPAPEDAPESGYDGQALSWCQD